MYEKHYPIHLVIKMIKYIEIYMFLMMQKKKKSKNDIGQGNSNLGNRRRKGSYFSARPLLHHESHFIAIFCWPVNLILSLPIWNLVLLLLVVLLLLLLLFLQKLGFFKKSFYAFYKTTGTDHKYKCALRWMLTNEQIHVSRTANKIENIDIHLESPCALPRQSHPLLP